VIRYLRPVLAPIRTVSRDITIGLQHRARQDLLSSCVHNTVLQSQLYPNLTLPECAPYPLSQHTKQRGIRMIMEMTWHCLALPSESCNRLALDMKPHGITVETIPAIDGWALNLKPDPRCPSFNSMMRGEVEGESRMVAMGELHNLTSGELGLRASYKVIFSRALRDKVKVLALMENDVLPHCQFRELLLSQLTDDRCSNHILSSRQGGILRLGATVHSKANWNAIDRDLEQRTSKSDGGQSLPKCYNAATGSFGGWAGLYHRSTFRAILKWLEGHPCEPVDWMYPWLSFLGYPMRVSYPNLAVPDVGHRSAVFPERNSNRSARAMRHRWALSDYCHSQ
jgi:hypothetical protein